MTTPFSNVGADLTVNKCINLLLSVCLIAFKMGMYKRCVIESTVLTSKALILNT